MAEARALGAFATSVHLPHEVAPLFRAWLDAHFADRAGKVMAAIRAMRWGRDNDPNFFTRMQGSSVWPELLRRRFHLAVKRFGLENMRYELDCDLKRRCRRMGRCGSSSRQQTE